MASGKKIPTLHSKALTIAIKRAMATRNISIRALARVSGVPYGTLRRVFRLDTVADYEQLQRLSTALRTPLVDIITDAERISEDPGVIADYQEESESARSHMGYHSHI